MQANLKAFLYKQNSSVREIAKAATSSDYNRNAILENVLAASFQDESHFIARAMFPTIGGASTGKYWKIKRSSQTQNVARLRAPGTESEAIRHDMEEASYACKPRSIKEIIAEEMANNLAEAGVLGTMGVAQILRIGSEIDWAAKYWQPAVWGRTLVGAASTVADTSYKYWSDDAAAPARNIKDERGKILLLSGQEANTLILGADVETYLTEHPTMLTRLNGGQTQGAADVTLDSLAKIFGVARVVTAKAAYNSSLSETPSFTRCVSPKSAWLGYVNPTPSRIGTSAGWRFTDKALVGNDQGVRNWEYWDQKTRATHIEGQVDETYEIVDKYCGVFFDGIVQ